VPSRVKLKLQGSTESYDAEVPFFTLNPRFFRIVLSSVFYDETPKMS